MSTCHHEQCGCSAADCCLECPAPACRYDDPVAFKRWRRYRHINPTNESAKAMAARLNVSTRTAHRIIAHLLNQPQSVENVETHTHLPTPSGHPPSRQGH